MLSVPGGRVWWELLAMSRLGRVRALISDEIGFKTHLLNFLTTNHPMNLNQIECDEHALSSTRRHTFNRNVVKLLDFVLERHNPCTGTVNVVVQQHTLLTTLAVNNTSHRRHQQPLWRSRMTFNIRPVRRGGSLGANEPPFEKSTKT